MSRRILVTGSRDWKGSQGIRVIMRALRKEPSKSELIEGEADGVDKMSRLVAECLGWRIYPVRADWKRYGLAAGPIRNREMLDMNPDYVYAFHSDIKKSKGTRDCIQEAKKRGIPGELIDYEGKVVDQW